MSMPNSKGDIKKFWDKKPCGTLGVIPGEVDFNYFERIRQRRYRLEPFIRGIVNFPKFSNKKVLEVGCGIGIDGLEFVKAGADYIGVDFSEQSAKLAEKNFALHGYNAKILVADAESLPFADNSFDFIYSWGVIHHTPRPELAISEIWRVLKPGGQFCIMIYNKYSLVGLQLYLIYGLLRFKLFIPWRKLFAEHHESPGTKAFTTSEAAALSESFSDVTIKNILTPYDLRISRNRFLPFSLMKHLIPAKLGFFKIIRGKK